MSTKVPDTMALETDEQSKTGENREREDDDPFAPLLSLEFSFYDEGYALGHAEGSTSGRIEGRLFGLSRGFEKFEDMGRLQGQALAWSARLHQSSATQPVIGNEEVQRESHLLRELKGGERTRKQVKRLLDVTDVEAVSTVNDEDGVADFDERLKEGKAKRVVIERIFGESASAVDRGAADAGKALKGSGEMEDFGGFAVGKAKG
nr:hypothetical protein B0A51_03663 [Rachicladosporium sp. CCFEE 5018]